MFQNIQLTALLIRRHATRGQRFNKSFDRVAIGEGEVRSGLLCLQDFVRGPHLTQRSFFPSSRMTMLSESASVTDSTKSNSVFAPWSLVRTACAGQVLKDLRACWDRVFLCRETAKDISKPWYHSGTLQSQAASTPVVTISVSWNRGMSSLCQLLRLLLVLLGPAKFVNPPAGESENIFGAPWGCIKNLRVPVSLLLPSFASTLTAHVSRFLVGSLAEVGVIDVPPQSYRWASHRDLLLHFFIRSFSLNFRILDLLWWYLFEIDAQFIWIISRRNPEIMEHWHKSGLYMKNIAKVCKNGRVLK